MLNSVLNGNRSNYVPGRQFPKGTAIDVIARNSTPGADIAAPSDGIAVYQSAEYDKYAKIFGE